MPFIPSSPLPPFPPPCVLFSADIFGIFSYRKTFGLSKRVLSVLLQSPQLYFFPFFFTETGKMGIGRIGYLTLKWLTNSTQPVRTQGRLVSAEIKKYKKQTNYSKVQLIRVRL